MGPEKIQISTGCQVEVNLVDRAGNKEKCRFTIVTDELADYQTGYLGESTALARTLIGEKEGIIIPYLKGDIHAIEILSVTKSMEQLSRDMVSERVAKKRKTIREIENTNAVVFASSFSGKWGDYDPDSIPKEDEQEKPD